VKKTDLGLVETTVLFFTVCRPKFIKLCRPTHVRDWSWFATPFSDWQRLETHSWYSKLNSLQKVYLGFFIF